MLAISGWAEDFILALLDRPFWARILLRFIFGKYAYREFCGLVKTVDDNLGGHVLKNNIGYGLADVEYHKDKVPLRWWKL